MIAWFFVCLSIDLLNNRSIALNNDGLFMSEIPSIVETGCRGSGSLSTNETLECDATYDCGLGVLTWTGRLSPLITAADVQVGIGPSPTRDRKLCLTGFDVTRMMIMEKIVSHAGVDI